MPEKVCQPPAKKLRNSSSLDTGNVDNSSWSQHIGDLFVYLDKSSVNEGILGISVKKTWVRKMIDFNLFIINRMKQKYEALLSDLFNEVWKGPVFD